MAVTKIHPIKTTLNKAIDYICNPDKTDDKVLISSYGCSYETADIEFGFTLSKARDKGDNLGHHLIQSFAPGEVSYEEAHRIGKELADKVLGGKYEYVLTTHIDKGHIHNHIIFCAVDFTTHRNPYCFRCGETIVRLCFAPAGNDLNSHLISFFGGLKKG